MILYQSNRKLASLACNFFTPDFFDLLLLSMGRLFHMVMATILNVLAGNQVLPPLVELSYAIPGVRNLFITLFAHLGGKKRDIQRNTTGKY